MITHSHIDILLVEDNRGDIQLITEALEETGANPKILTIRDGMEAIRLLRREPPFQDAPKPSIIILDLNLPRKDGREILTEIKSDPALAIIPVIIFSGSDAPQDISACYALHANCYIVKPRDLHGLTETIRSLVDFWLMKVKLPPGPDSDMNSERKNAN
jgi:chemotaxis family two-component system response regulator Rcp1